MYKITRYHDFCAGHRVVGHENKCSLLHGHNYRVFFTAAPRDMLTLDGVGRVIDFSEVKAKLCQWLEDNWDHKMLLWEKDPLVYPVQNGDLVGYGMLYGILRESIVVVPFNPTAENMAAYLLYQVGPEIFNNDDMMLVSVTVEETRKCSATCEVP